MLGSATLLPTYSVGFRYASPNLLGCWVSLRFSQPTWVLGFARLLPTYSPNLLGCWVSLRFSQPTLPTYLGVGFRCASPNLLSQPTCYSVSFWWRWWRCS
ncbi:MAG: hypothetical protein EA414_16750 [Arthrospira sp. PLM2.Bin9]|nr:MAG: hypothetical protein EA414_16750 [Arthrospira sp. PLM2.Bin9]